jgi:hypothetical protein
MMMVMAAAATSVGADPADFEAGMPARMENACRIVLQGREVQGLARRKDGSGDRAGGQGAVLRGLGRSIREILGWPPSVFDETSKPSRGGNAEDVDTTPGSILSGAFGTSFPGLDRVGLSAAWIYDGLPLGDEWDDSDLFGSGLGRRIDLDAAQAGDPISGQEGFEDIDMRLIELGSSRRDAPRSVVSVGTGPGATEETPDVRLIFGFERLF